MLFFRLTLVPIQEGKMQDAMSYAETKVDEFVGIPGLLQVALCENSDSQLMSWSTWLSEDSMNGSSEQLAEALGGLKDFVTGPPEISFGPMTAGQQYVNIMKGDREGQSFVVRIGYGSEYIEEKYDEGMDWLQNTVYAGYEGTEGLLGAFAVDVGGKFVTLSNWDSQEALDGSLESFQQIMADAQNYIKSPPTIVTGECSIWRNMASFPAGKLSEWSK
jgi:heme-degrading monooxygenase HmoA